MLTKLLEFATGQCPTALRQLLLEKNDWQVGSRKDNVVAIHKKILHGGTTHGPARTTKISSDATTSVEKNYTQIEKEILGLVFACENVHDMCMELR